MALERGHQRLERRVAVQIESEGRQYTATSGNLSLGGMFIETTLSLNERSRIKLSFSVPTDPDPIVVDAEVRWTEPRGAGACFLGLRARQMWALTKFLGTAESLSDGQAAPEASRAHK